jgi:hypothetical protein
MSRGLLRVSRESLHRGLAPEPQPHDLDLVDAEREAGRARPAIAMEGELRASSGRCRTLRTSDRRAHSRIGPRDSSTIRSRVGTGHPSTRPSQLNESHHLEDVPSVIRPETSGPCGTRGRWCTRRCRGASVPRGLARHRLQRLQLRDPAPPPSPALPRRACGCGGACGRRRRVRSRTGRGRGCGAPRRRRSRRPTGRPARASKTILLTRWTDKEWIETSSLTECPGSCDPRGYTDCHSRLGTCTPAQRGDRAPVASTSATA